MESLSVCTAEGCKLHHVHWAFPPFGVHPFPAAGSFPWAHLHQNGAGVPSGGRGVISLLFPFSRTDDPIQKYYLNITNHFSWSAVEVTLGLYTSLCQYFSEQEKRWKTEGIVPLEETRPDQAVCLTQHLTAFGASLFVPPNSVQFIFPVSTAEQRLCSAVTHRTGCCHLEQSHRLLLVSCPSWHQHRHLEAFGRCRWAQLRGSCVPWLGILAGNRPLQMALVPGHLTLCSPLREMPKVPPSCHPALFDPRELYLPAAPCIPGARSSSWLCPCDVSRSRELLAAAAPALQGHGCERGHGQEGGREWEWERDPPGIAFQHFSPLQAPGPGLNYIVLLTCAVCFVTYSVAALIVHKLDVIDMNRVGVIPFCGKNGMYKYEILVKTGWGRGSGEPAACSTVWFPGGHLYFT